MTQCFRASNAPNQVVVPDWLTVEFAFDAKEPRCYSIWVVPWIAGPAMAVGALEVDGSSESWIAYLENLGFADVVQVSCHEFFGPRADRDR
ncbi:hypothetical protein [Leptolyngbya sp. FACHB-261]|uniref:hypothetical protein n=1 Tax=Leptolyngbya sp. FACHB-261 TaxID=2692806 RepID=UPI001685C80F|nr:hypothetical protein [Leptolyngbya sp. FACHB-261]MBD2103659.1 hypothetical protein [Leptolyngbya sp. FACHB-261]